MRIFIIQDPDGVHTFSEMEVKEFYFPLWKDNMIRAGKENQITFENCIEDFIVVNCAIVEEVKDE